MSKPAANIAETRMEAGGWISGKIHCPWALHPRPGQYLLARREDGSDIFPATLFIARSEGAFLYTASALPADWSAGTQIMLRGPLGNGFSLPDHARRVLLAAPQSGEPFLLTSLMHQALAQQADVAVYAESGMSDLPREVELLTAGQMADALRWADFSAVQTTPAHLAGLRGRIGLGLVENGGCPIQVLVHSDFACGGAALCGVCAVKTRRGWQLACKDGPVFDFYGLEVE